MQTAIAKAPDLSKVSELQQNRILSVRDLRTAFRENGRWKEVVKGISFDVKAGETLAIVGESGSGKSVTGYSIMRLLSPDTARINGEVFLGSRNLLSLSEDEMRAVRGNHVSMIFQEAMTSLNPVFPIGQQISESLMLHNPMTAAAAKAEALRLMDRVRIPAAKTRYDEYPHNFSGGMRQRSMIAMALACRPQLLIADEPTTALDVTIQAQILNLIKEIQEEEKMSVIFITHDMGVVAEVAERMVVMLKGDVVETGTTEAIFDRAEHPYTRALLSAVPQLGSMQGIPYPLKFPIVNPKTGETSPADEPVATVKTSDAPVLEVKNLSVRFDIRGGWFRRVISRIHAAEDVSFDLRPGETLSIVGESGCGKSTTGRGLMRLVEPAGGSVRLAGREIMSLAHDDLRDARRDIQMVFQDPYASLSPRRTVGQAIAEPYLTHKLGTAAQARKLVGQILERVGLSPDMAERLPHQFSGGQRQRICIARALVLSPKVIVADESVSALDVSVKAQVINLLLDLQRELRLAFVFISHDMAVVERISHRVAVMYLGEIVEIGPRQSIFENAQHPYTKKLLSAVPLPDPSRRLAKRVIDVEELPSALRAIGYERKGRVLREVSPGHFVQVT
ncbi:ABC transporter ATP-binding protein (plasmid) [Agrobacterium tumefaciens]|uniref:ABC transporter ATP-binding protein n=1 Tax=Agrobacterium TaxID=357 RepID=UPI00080FC9FC|nr:MULTISPECIES: ABC transporter ATP-binding protein [Agrobacterium]NSY46401.1 ABC transporter ATP-binding protein [Agrobacterium tumefaciens]NSZ76862.1 ABC transporter ATP-binding protein [Agrobacterium tumefaciens]NSZ87342.1 ABC transporter ATP-binding protein [Agrobacterium tumefaciens]UZX45352.1 ABC transporter ATP-binding protein [Agrobacterium sp. 13-2099-1-2]WCA72761.1 ABC transporter ATP-binding protein [Agrobacterium tumefaciens]